MVQRRSDSPRQPSLHGSPHFSRRTSLRWSAASRPRSADDRAASSATTAACHPPQVVMLQVSVRAALTATRQRCRQHRLWRLEPQTHGSHVPNSCQYNSCQYNSTETKTLHLVLFGMQNRTFCPYLAAIHRILIPAMHARTSEAVPWITPPPPVGPVDRNCCGRSMSFPSQSSIICGGSR
jgi:hypothetical protein